MKNWPLKNRDSVSVSDRIEIAFENARIKYFTAYLINQYMLYLIYLLLIEYILNDEGYIDSAK